MDKRSRAWKLYQLGLAEYHEDSEGNNMLLCMAVMLDAATAKGGKRAPLMDADAVAFLDTILQVAGDRVDADPFDASWYKQMEWKLRDLSHPDVSVAYRVGEYLAGGGWKGKTAPTVSLVIRYLGDLMKQAEEAGTHDPRFSV